MLRPYDSDVQDFLTGSDVDDLVTPLSGAMRTGEWTTFSVDVWLRALVAAKVRIGVQFSNNPFDFTDTAKPLDTAYITVNGWTYGTSEYDLYSVTGATTRTWFRFVALGLNTTGGFAGGGQIRIVVLPKQLKAFIRLVTGFVRANTKGTDASAAKTPSTEVFDTTGITHVRHTLEVAAISGPSRIQVGIEETDTPDDPTSWTSVGLLGSEVTATGTTFPTVFASITFTKRYGRGVISNKNESLGTDIEAAMTRLALELRG